MDWIQGSVLLDNYQPEDRELHPSAMRLYTAIEHSCTWMKGVGTLTVIVVAHIPYIAYHPQTVPSELMIWCFFVAYS